MDEKTDFSPEDIREPLEELFAYIPYFEERVHGTFKFQYYDEEKDQMVDFEGYEEKNRAAKFPYPTDDETFVRFKDLFIEKIWAQRTIPRPPKTEIEKLSPQQLFMNVLFALSFDLIHERLCTGHTAWCMEKGRYLMELKLLQSMLGGEIKTSNDIVEAINGLHRKYGISEK